MNGILIFLGVIALGVVAFFLLERYWKGWRTWLVNGIAGLPVLGGLLADLLVQFRVSEHISEANMLWYLLAVIALNLFARWQTTTPLGRQHEFLR